MSDEKTKQGVGRGGKRENSGRKKTGRKVFFKTFSVVARIEDYEYIKSSAKNEKLSISKFIMNRVLAERDK